MATDESNKIITFSFDKIPNDLSLAKIINCQFRNTIYNNINSWLDLYIIIIKDLYKSHKISIDRLLNNNIIYKKIILFENIDIKCLLNENKKIEINNYNLTNLKPNDITNKIESLLDYCKVNKNRLIVSYINQTIKADDLTDFNIISRLKIPKEKNKISNKDLEYKNNTLNIDFNNIEKDMLSLKSSETKIENIFAMYPLIGNFIIYPDFLRGITEKTKYLIDEYFNKTHFCTLQEKMIITLTIVNFARIWANYNINLDLWDYIALQLDKNLNYKLMKFFKETIEDSLKNKRFLLSKNDNDFQSTLLIHALAPKKHWITLIDILYNFYKANLKSKYIRNSTVLKSFVKNLILLFSSNEEYDFIVNKKAYNINELDYIKILLLKRPAFTFRLFEKIILNINNIIKFRGIPTHTYLDFICNQWYNQRRKR